MQAPDSAMAHEMFHCLCLKDFDFPNCLLLAQGPFRGKKGPPLGLRAGSSAPSSGATVPLTQLDDTARPPRPLSLSSLLWSLLQHRSLSRCFSDLPTAVPTQGWAVFCPVGRGRRVLGTAGTLCIALPPGYILVASGPTDSSGYQLSVLPSFTKHIDRVGAGGVIWPTCFFFLFRSGAVWGFRCLPTPTWAQKCLHSFFFLEICFSMCGKIWITLNWPLRPFSGVQLSDISTFAVSSPSFLF